MAVIVARKDETIHRPGFSRAVPEEHGAFAVKVSDAERVVLFVIAFGVLFGVLTSVVSPEYFHDDYAREDGFVEWMTVVALTGAAWLCGERLYFLWRSKDGLFLLSTMVALCAFIFGAGEELSWGQRIFGFNVPAFFLKYNSQKDFTIHNLRFHEVKLNKLIFSQLLGLFVVAYLLPLPYLYRKHDAVRHWINRFALPVPTKSQVACFFVVTVATLLIRDSRKWEVLEFAGSSTFALIFLNPLNRHIFDP
jgi:hypothetical protein